MTDIQVLIFAISQVLWSPALPWPLATHWDREQPAVACKGPQLSGMLQCHQSASESLILKQRGRLWRMFYKAKMHALLVGKNRYKKRSLFQDIFILQEPDLEGDKRSLVHINLFMKITERSEPWSWCRKHFILSGLKTWQLRYTLSPCVIQSSFVFLII